MKKPIYIFRYFSLIAITCSLIGSLLLFFIGTWKTYNAIRIVFFDYIPSGNEHLHSIDNATIYLMKSLDTFLIAMALFIFAYGIFTLFISNKKDIKDNGVLQWIAISNIGHLKNILAELIIIILFVIFLEVIIENINNLKWEFLIIPISVLLLALGLKYLKLENKDDP
ncbi:MAG: YqhA family protein [Bacteroidetes bacterium]|nr:YqhA family protein [Bacteroidota bacterium]MBP7398522.1 YqhA family protein [Chitinophagales bacterium]MBK7109444.1 YqhA family protein [Bacteroidota bacterium]MBK8487814.1 YqhA family protein [Bacteroidota bacterium]MBK8682431.1 YqhA family protein [Bacteroidota bacterium]